jgi:hypothetical protein
MSGSNFTDIISALGWFVDISTTGLIPVHAHDQGVHLNKATCNILSMQFPVKQYDTAESENSLTFAIVRFARPALQGRRNTQFVRMIFISSELLWLYYCPQQDIKEVRT